jgi:ABC-type amino acid transport substrate-binding protein
VLRKFFVVGSGIVSIVLLLLAATGIQAADRQFPDLETSKATVYGTVWGQTLAQDGTGFYNDIFNDLAALPEKAVDYKLMPYRRARAQFLADKSACLYPSARAVLLSGGHDVGLDLIETDAVFMAQEHLFAAAGVTPPKSLADLDGKTVAVPTGSVMLKLLAGTGAQLISVNDETAKAQMLITGRVDMMSGMLPNEHLIFQSLDTRMASYDRNFLLIDAGVGVVCHNTAANQAFIRQVNDRITELQASAAFQDRLAAAGVAETPYAGAADLNDIVPAAGSKLRFVHPGRRVPFSNIR